jgi:hypothetical protein
MKPGELIEELRQALEVMDSRSFTVSSSLTDVMGALVGQDNRVPLELPWDEEVLGEKLTRHQVILVGLDDEGGRICFFNPAAAAGLRAGTHLGGPGQGPPRRVEHDNVQSMDLAEFARFFAEGHAYALLPQT